MIASGTACLIGFNAGLVLPGKSVKRGLLRCRSLWLPLSTSKLPEPKQVLYILSKGLVALDSRVGYNGAVWGEDFVLSDTSLIRPVAGYALTYIEVLFLTRDALMEVIAARVF